MFPRPSVTWPWQSAAAAAPAPATDAQAQAAPAPVPAPVAPAAPTYPYQQNLAPGYTVPYGDVALARSDSGYGEVDTKPFGEGRVAGPVAGPSGSAADVKPDLRQRDVKPVIKSSPPKEPPVELDLGAEGLKDVTGFSETDVYTPEAGLARATTILDNLSSILTRKELATLQDKIKAPKRFLIAVVGATGAGKSSLINALLGAEVVPTNSMRACTATVSEISYHDSPKIKAAVEFLSPQSGGQSSPCSSPIGKDLGKSKKRDKDGGEKQKKADQPQEYWPLIKVVRIFTKAECLKEGVVLTDLPGTADSNNARGKIARDYMKNASAMWIVAPQGRAVDDKVASDLLGESFRRTLQLDGSLSRLTFVTTRSDDVSPREAARSIPSLREELEPLEEEQDELTAEKKASGLVTKAAKAELATAIEALKAADADITEWEERLETKQEDRPYVSKLKTQAQKANEKKGKSKASKSKGKKKAVESDSDIDFIDDDSDSDSDAETPKKKRKGSHSDSDDSDDDGSDEEVVVEEEADPSDDMTEEDIEALIKTKKADLKLLRAEKKEKKAAVDASTANTTRIEKKMSKLQKGKARLAALARNNYTRSALAQDFRQGLRQLDDANAEARDGHHWDPSIPQRDYDAINLPVFCCSSREFAKLSGLAKGDGKAQVFTKKSETGIPSLRRHTKALTHAPRYHDAESLLKDVRDFASTVALFLAADGSAGNDVAALRIAYRQQISLERLEFESLARDGREPLSHNFDTIENRIEEGAAAAQRVAEETIRSFDDLHWSTYRATTRRHGCFSGSKGPKNFNGALAGPILKELGSAWERAFSSPRALLGTFERDVLDSVDKFASDLARSTTDSASTSARFDSVARQTKTHLVNRLGQWVEAALTTIDEQQREAHRALEPAIQEALAGAYDESCGQRGTGSSLRAKTVMWQEVHDRKDQIFSAGIDGVMNRLRKIKDDVENVLTKAVTDALRLLSENFSTLFEKFGIADPRALAYRKLAHAAVIAEYKKISSILTSTTPAPQLVIPGDGDEEEEEEEAPEPVKKKDRKGKGKAKADDKENQAITLDDAEGGADKMDIEMEKTAVRVTADDKGRVVLEID